MSDGELLTRWLGLIDRLSGRGLVGADEAEALRVEAVRAVGVRFE